MLIYLFQNASFSPSPNLHTCMSLVEVFKFGQCLGKRFSPVSTFLSLVSSGAFIDEPHSLLRCRNPNQCLPNFLKMLILVLPKIYTCVFHLLKSIDLDYTRFWFRDFKLCLLDFLKMLDLGISEIYTRVFNCGSLSLWTMLGLEILAHLYFFSLA